MKSRTSSYNRTLFKKNVTRFMPFWVLYTLCLLLGLMMLSDGDKEFHVALSMGECARMMAVVNCGYALLVAQLLFGDLYDSRMCNGLHAMPMRREEIFGVNILTGLLASLIPSLIMCLASLPLMVNTVVVKGWQLSFLWLLADNLEFIFFYGLAVLCVFFAGNRFSMAVLYGILNFWAVLVSLMLQSLYLPMLEGVGASPVQWFSAFCPVLKISGERLVLISREMPDPITGAAPASFVLEPHWGYLWLCAGIGLVLMVIALALYRKRRLETAGDFIAVKALKPVFLVVFPMMAACGFNVVAQSFYLQSREVYGVVFSCLGLLLGWFVGCMLLQKSTRVFSKRSFLGAGLLLLVLVSSFLLTWADPLNLEGWLPRPETVKSVRITNNYDYYRNHTVDSESADIDRFTDRGTIDLAIRLHELALENGLSDRKMNRIWEQSHTEEGIRERDDRYVSISLEYILENGSVRRRTYYVPAEGEIQEIASWLLSRPEIVFGSSLPMLNYGIPAENIHILGRPVPEQYWTPEEFGELRDAMLQDAREGHLAQDWNLHRGSLYREGEYQIDSFTMDMYLGSGDKGRNLWIAVYPESVHTLKWLRSRGILEDVIQQELEQMKKYS